MLFAIRTVDIVVRARWAFYFFSGICWAVEGFIGLGRPATLDGRIRAPVAWRARLAFALASLVLVVGC